MNVSSVTKHFPTANKGFITTLGSTISGGAATVPLTSVSGLNNGDVFVGIIEPGDPNEQEFTGTVDTAGVQITGVKWTDGTNVDHTAGVTIVDYVSATGQNIQTKGMLVEHKQTGAHSDVTADSIVVTGDVTAANFVQSGGADSAGWTVGLPAVSSVTANGNRSYTVAFASDVASTLSEGMRLRTTRTVASTQNAFSLDGSNDYYNKTSPAGMTFTDDFSVSAWVYMTSYQAGTIASRRNATQGWAFTINSSGQLVLVGYKGALANYSWVTCYQSIPLNKWVHVAAQLDMSAYTATTTTSYIMIDGVNVPATVYRAGTNPTDLTQAGNLEIGSADGGSSPFPGYIDQVAIYSAKVTQATHLAAMTKGLTGSETSLISAYSNGSTTDLSATGNNLTAQNGATTVASSPFGNRGLSTTLDYGLVMKVATTTVTVQVPEGCTIPTSGGVSAVSYSTQANPYGFVSDKGRWEVLSLLKTDTTTTSNATYGAFISGGWSLFVPIGGWSVEFAGNFHNATTTTVLFNASDSVLTGDSILAAANKSPLAVVVRSSAAAQYFITSSMNILKKHDTAATYVVYTFGATASAGINGSANKCALTAVPSSL